MSNQTSSNSTIQYKPGHDRPTGYVVNDFETYADTSLVTCWRTYKGKSANYNHDTDVATVVNVSNAIDLVENNEDAMDQIIWGMTHPEDVNPGVASIVANPALIDLLLVRHYKKWGGLVLPPLQAARKLQDAYKVVAEQEKDRGLQWGGGRSLMKYPKGVRLGIKLHLRASRLQPRLLRRLLVLVAMLVVDEAEIAVVVDLVVATRWSGMVEDVETVVE